MTLAVPPNFLDTYRSSGSLEPPPSQVIFVCRISNEIVGQYGKRVLVCLSTRFPMDFERVFFYYFNRPKRRTEHAALVYGYGRERNSASVCMYIHLEREKKREREREETALLAFHVCVQPHRRRRFLLHGRGGDGDVCDLVRSGRDAARTPLNVRKLPRPEWERENRWSEFDDSTSPGTLRVVFSPRTGENTKNYNNTTVGRT